MDDTAQELSKSLALRVEAAGPSVVRVEGRRRRPPSSGVVWSADGLIVTADHAVEWDEEVPVGLADGRVVAARLLGRDPTTDVAVLRAAETGLVPAAWADASDVKVGHLVLAVTRPGRTVRASLGIASVVAEGWRTAAGGRLDQYLQSDIPLHPGFSGSLLVDASGRALGLNTAGLIRGHSTAVPTATLRRVVASLVAHGQIRRGFLGVGTAPVRLPPDLARQLGQPSALLIVSVEPDSPAARAGLFLGDVLASVEGQPVRHAGDLLAFLEEERIGTEVTGKVLRAGELRDVRLTVGTRGGAAADS